MRIIADTHTHTLASGHAYSTIHENAAAAAQKGLSFIAVTDHTEGTPGAPGFMYFLNAPAFPKKLAGVHILAGCEVNIIDFEGGLELHPKILDKLDWVIASFHEPPRAPGSAEEHTRAYLAVAQNPLVDVIGHCGNGAYPFDYERCVRAFAEQGKIVEINNHSFTARKGSTENCEAIARLCMRYGVPVVVSSDAHNEQQVGEFATSMELLERIGFPEELVLNADAERFARVAAEKSGRSFG